MATILDTYEAVIDMGGGGEASVRRDDYGWRVDHISFHGDHGSIIGARRYDTWHQAMMAAIAYAVEHRKPRP